MLTEKIHWISVTEICFVYTCVWSVLESDDHQRTALVQQFRLDFSARSDFYITGWRPFLDQIALGKRSYQTREDKTSSVEKKRTTDPKLCVHLSVQTAVLCEVQDWIQVESPKSVPSCPLWVSSPLSTKGFTPTRKMILLSKRVAIFCSLLSAWGIIMLTLMGILLYSHAVTFAEDLELHTIESDSIGEFLPEAYQRYESAAHNCWIAACLYIATMAFSMHQYMIARRQQYGFWFSTNQGQLTTRGWPHLVASLISVLCVLLSPSSHSCLAVSPRRQLCFYLPLMFLTWLHISSFHFVSFYLVFPLIFCL